VLLVDPAQETAASFVVPGSDQAEFSERSGLLMVSSFSGAKLMRLAHLDPPVLSFARGKVRSWTLSPLGKFVAARTPVGPWNGTTTLTATANGRANRPAIESSGVVFFGADEQFYAFDETGNLLVYDPRTAAPARVLTQAVGSYLGVPSSSQTDFLAWEYAEGMPEISVNLATGAMTAWRAVDATGRVLPEGFRLMDLSSDRKLALFDLDGSFSLQTPEVQVLAIEAQRAVLMPATGQVALVSHTGGVDVRSTDGQLELQVLVDDAGYVMRGKTFSVHGKVDPRALTCRVGRHFLPAELCWTNL